MAPFWKVICSATVAAGLLVVLFVVRDGTLDILVAVVLVVALAVLARAAIRFASDPTSARGEDEHL